MTKNNFNIPNYIHLSYQGFLDDKMNMNKKLQLRSAMLSFQKKINQNFKTITGLTVEQYLDYVNEEIESMKSMINLFTGDVMSSGGEQKLPFSEIWKKYGAEVENRVNSLPLTSQEKQELLNYTKASAKTTNIAIALKLLSDKSIKSIENDLANITSDFDEQIMEEFKSKIANNSMNKKDWANILVRQAAIDALQMKGSLQNLNNIKETKTFGQLIGTEYDTLIDKINQLNTAYASGADSKKIMSLANNIRALLNRHFKGTGTETVSFLNLPIIKEKSKIVVRDLIHTGLSTQDIASYSKNIKFTRSGSGGNKTNILTTSGKREIKLADVTLELQVGKKIKKATVSRKMRDIQAKHIQLATNMNVAQANALILKSGLGKQYAVLTNDYSFAFYNAVNFMLIGKNMWYVKRQNSIYLKVDNSRARAKGNFSSMKKVEESIKNEIISSFLGATYASFFVSKFAAFYDINNFIVPSPLLFEYSLERILSEDLQTGIRHFVNLNVNKKNYEQIIRNNGSGEKSVLHNGIKYYPFQLMALKRNKAAIQEINSVPITVKSYNITNQQYYNDMFNKLKK